MYLNLYKIVKLKKYTARYYDCHCQKYIFFVVD